MKKIVRSMLILFVVVALIGIVSANNTIKTNFDTTYSTTETRLDTCDTCHIPGQSASAATLNSYGKDLQNNSENFAAIESNDSDKDGFTNIEEIDNLTFPGNSNDFPPQIIGFGPSSPVSNTSIPATQTFNVTVNQAVDNLTWTLDGEVNKTGHNSAVSSNTITVNVVGVHTVTLTAERTGDGSAEVSWTWNVETTTPPPQGANTFNISGYKLNGSDNTGIKGWNITIKNNTMVSTIKTDDNGSYKFTGLINGSYNITEETRTDFTPVGPTFQNITIAGSDKPNINFTNNPVTVPVPSPTVTPTVTPSEFGSISGHATVDVNGNGVKDAGDTPLSGLMVQLIGITEEDGREISIKDATTDDQGLYTFGNLPAGTYFVMVKFKAGFIPVGHRTTLIYLSKGENSADNDFLLRPFGTMPTPTVTAEPTTTPEVTPTVTATTVPTVTPTVTVTAVPTATNTVIPTVTVTAGPTTTNTGGG